MSEVANQIDQFAVADAVRAAYEARSPIAPIGGGTSLDYGGSASADATRLDLTALNRIVDYTPRDMTIVVEAGIRMAELAATLAAEKQQLPIDVPRAAEATVGGAVATNWSGSRRYGYGTWRDYVIGVHAVDGRGVAFKGGGRVVKNVAGYDFCKLLTGSLGTLGVITQLAFKVKPLAEQSATVAATLSDLTVAEELLRRLNELAAPPVAIDLLTGHAWNASFPAAEESSTDGASATIVVRVEGTEPEVSWLAERTQYEMWGAGAVSVRLLPSADANTLDAHLREFTDRGAGDAPDNSPLVLKFAVPPSAVTATIDEVRRVDSACTILAHAANGIVFARFAKFAATDVSAVLVAQLRPATMRRGGNVVVVQTTLEGLTPHLRWGGRTEATVLMERIKRQFDPHGVLNPGRFVFKTKEFTTEGTEGTE
jgi:glycolate oxidase FAD binding subunit